MKLIVNDLQRMIMTSSTKIPFSWIIDACFRNGYTAEEVKKEMIAMKERGLIEIEREDFVIIDYMAEK
jgi:hypothetical protein